MHKTSNGTYIQDVLEPIGAALNEEAARKLIGLKANRKARARVAQLARKCNEGALTAEARDEYETYVLAGDVIAILQAQARILLARCSQLV